MEIRKRRKPRSTPQHPNNSTNQQFNKSTLLPPPTGRWHAPRAQPDWQEVPLNAGAFRGMVHAAGWGRDHYGRRREQIPNMHSPPAAAHLFTPCHARAPFRALCARNPHHNPHTLCWRNPHLNPRTLCWRNLPATS